ncbi:unnamed protein product [Blepharisma stoltei]|uniref:LITAF domain-containing protein n=1 Tax=Blepharisma stoltei TaxID=1481888 RepID=A0AAU9JRX8_9CILI|nr:unnamed protein product [Blepharisma stoltei]
MSSGEKEPLKSGKNNPYYSQPASTSGPRIATLSQGSTYDQYPPSQYRAPSEPSYPPPQQYQAQPYYPQDNQNQDPYYNAVILHNEGRDPVQLYCPVCRRTVWTKIDTKPGWFTWLCCTLLCLIGCWLCCCIPFCIKRCKDTYHYCSVCSRALAIVEPYY